MRNTRRIATVACVALTTGCYTLQPVANAAQLPAGQQVAFDVNDVGRVALGGSMGPSIATIEGRLVRADSGSYLVAVKSVRLISGLTQPWTGEPVQIKADYVSAGYERRLSKSRTAVAAAAGVAAVAFIVTRSVTGGGTGREPEIPHDTLGTTNRGPRP